MKKDENSDPLEFRSLTTSVMTPDGAKTILQRSIKAGLKKAISFEDIAGQIDVNPKVLKETVERWNALCQSGEDKDHKAPA